LADARRVERRSAQVRRGYDRRSTSKRRPRFTLAALVAVPLALRHGRWRGAPLGRLAAVGLMLQVVQFGGVYGGFALGVPAALSALAMLGLSPLVTTALAIGSGQERGDARLWAGLAIGVVGVAITWRPSSATRASASGSG
jgi:drug/metabolite transporter (DMT)-like permease